MESSKSWKYVALILGVIFAFIGILAIIFPTQVIQFLPLALGIILLIAGIVKIVQGIGEHKLTPHTGNMDIVLGIVYILLSLLFLFTRNFTVLLLTVFIGVWALVNGCVKIASTFSLSSMGMPWGLVLADGIIDVLLGLLILFNPFGGSLVIAIIAGIYLLYYGISMIAFSFWFTKE